MLQNPVIKRLSAVMLLALFAIGITPRRELHALFAHHRDYAAKFAGRPDSPQLGNTGFSCHIDNLVAESPFTDADSPIHIEAPDQFGVLHIALVSALHSSYQYFSALRGPPALI